MASVVKEVPSFRLSSPELVPNYYPQYESRLNQAPGIIISTPGVFTLSTEIKNANYYPTPNVVDTNTKWGPIKLDGYALYYDYEIVIRGSIVGSVTWRWKKYSDFEHILGQRSRMLTAADRFTQINELNYHVAWGLLAKRDLITMIDPNKWKDVWMGFVEQFQSHYKPVISSWYAKRDTSVFSGTSWKQLVEDGTDDQRNYLFETTEKWYEKYLEALNEETYMLMPPFNLGLRNRPFDRFTLSEVPPNGKPFKITKKKVPCMRTRIVQFHEGPSSGASGCNCPTEKDHTHWIADTFKKYIVDRIGISNFDGPLINGAKAYAHYFQLLNEGWVMAAVDGIRWESSVGMIGDT
jgi:hypothetical protein